ncbi:MAG: cyclophilin family peptidyl-prolyl cis-trans isomerase [Myxococcota bacterium]|jgi:cyclophilin family peptidyl-prolyl cis-trans isomerase
MLLWMGMLLVACGEDTLDSEEDTGGGFFGEGGSHSGDVELVTTLGVVVIGLESELTPETTENFLSYVSSGFYDGSDGGGATTFHRVIDNFMVQGGGYTTEGQLKGTQAPIVLESNVGLSNLRGTISMARTKDPNSATSQFFINLVDNLFLDYKGESSPGYAVFGEVIEGMEVIDEIGGTATGSGDVPLSVIELESVSVF